MFAHLILSKACKGSKPMARHYRMRYLAVATVMLAATTAMAGSLVNDSVSTCTTENCSSVQVNGTASVVSLSGGSEPFAVQVFAGSGECLRLDVDLPNDLSKDLEEVVVGPNGIVWRNDDRNGGSDRRPLVKIASTPAKGWYTVQVAQFDGQPDNLDFRLRYGRYNAGNPNCSPGTAPLVSAPGTAPASIK